MCDPLTLGALAIGAAGTAANSIGQAKAQKQEGYNAGPRSRRRTAPPRTSARRACAGRRGGAADRRRRCRPKARPPLRPPKQSGWPRSDEEGDVKPTPSPTAPASVADATLTGWAAAARSSRPTWPKGLADAAASAKQRIGALATVNSYGGTFGSLGTVNPLARGRSARHRRSQCQTKRIARCLRRRTGGRSGEITYSNPIADVASSFLSVGAQGAGASPAAAAGLGKGAGGQRSVVLRR